MAFIYSILSVIMVHVMVTFNWITSVKFEDQPHLQYLQPDSRRNLNMLNKHPAVKSVFLRFNSMIPSSAAVEKLFSAGAIILSKRRNRFNYDTFEKRLF